MTYDRPAPPRRKRHISRRALFGFIALLVAIAYGIITIARPFDQLQPSVKNDTLSITTPTSNLPWPSDASGAFGLLDGTVIATHGEQTALPTASTAKLLTALCVLEKHPLTSTESGPIITLTSADVALYNNYVAIHGSVLPVSAGQNLTERQMLQALLLPSANNIADSLAIWSFGSVDNYLTYANKYLQQHGLTDSRVADDASGLSPKSVATARDLVKLGALAMSNQAIASIVAQPTAVIPGVGTVRNVDTLLGKNNIIGAKTGNSDQNGGAFVGAAVAMVNGKRVTLISALTGSSSLPKVLADSNNLLTTIQTTFAQTSIVKAGTVLGTYQTADGRLVQAVAAAELSALVLRGDTATARVTLSPIKYGAKTGQTVGTVSLKASEFNDAKSVPIVLKQSPVKPRLSYRLTHP